MSFWSKLTRHERLFSRMADRAGADVDVAMQSGLLVPEDFRSAVLSCSICTRPKACETLLDDGGTDIPDYCRNRKMLERLATDIAH